MEKQRSIKVLSVVALIVAVLGLTVAFAALSSTLTVKGSATVGSGSWDIHFENLGVGQTIGKAEITSEATLSGTTSISGFAISLKEPGDGVIYTFDVKNGGNIPAKVSEITKPSPVCSGDTNAEAICQHLKYEFTYADGSQINQDDTLAADEVKNLKLRLVFDEDKTMTSEQLPTDDVQIDLGTSSDDNAITIIYAQQ